MAKQRKATMDGNTAAAHVGYAFNEVAAIYPITPSSGMGELSDAWASEGRKNIFGTTVDVMEMQSEAGAAGAVHGALSAGALTTTFTASQGLMLMLPNMHKIAGEMLPTVFYVTARSLAAQSLSIFGDHSDVMSARNTGYALVACNSVQEVMDLAIVCQLATLKTSIPFLCFFDGFRTSHELQKVDVVDYETMAELIDPALIEDFRKRALTPDTPRVKVGQQGPDVYFQGRETSNLQYQNAPAIIQQIMDEVGAKLGRNYKLFDYVGHPEAEDVIVAMGSGCETVQETIEYLNKERGMKLGLVKVRVYRPFSVDAFRAAVPQSVKRIAVLDRTKEPGSIGEPLYLDVVSALKDRCDLSIIGGRYGLSSKEFTPSMVLAIYKHLAAGGFHGFTVGIEDDVSKLSLPLDEIIHTVPQGTISCKFWGLGSDGTVGANKNSIKIIGDNTDLNVQGYFQYDSKKSGGITRSHLRFGKTPIHSQYLVAREDFVACHNQAFIGRYDLLSGIKENGVFLLNSNWERDEAFNHLTCEMQESIITNKIKFFNIDGLKIAEEVGLGGRVNTVMQTAFFLISGVMDRNEAISLIKESIKKTYARKGDEIVKMNLNAVDKVNEALVEVDVPASIPDKCTPRKQLVPEGSTGFVKDVIEPIMREQGDVIKVSQMPLDGYVESGTAKLEKRRVAPAVPKWISENCIQCNQCSFVCPHAAIRAKLIKEEDLKAAPGSFKTLKAMGAEGYQYKIQVYIDDCQSCRVCVNECPKQALVMSPIEEEREAGEQANYEFFEKLPNDVLGNFKEATVKGSQFKQPLLEFSGACAGCGETPYIKLLTQLFGDRMIIANATGCSSIWGGTFPTMPYAKNKDGKGPAWANSLFEDNAEYGFGMRLAVNSHRKQLKIAAEALMEKGIDPALKEAIGYALANWDKVDPETKANAEKIRTMLPGAIEKACEGCAKLLRRVDELKDYFVQKSIWAIGGDGWAYDIGYGGLDHVMASNQNIKIFVLDTEVYSNTGGQASKSTPMGSIARFAEAGKTTNKKDLGMMMMSYGYVYVAAIAMGANKNQALQAIKEAEEYPGPAIVIAYAPCINHGIDMSMSQKHEKAAVDAGYWLLYRYNPQRKLEGKNPLILDSKEPSMSVADFIKTERRYSGLHRIFPERAEQFEKCSAIFFKERYEQYKKLSE
ncbi:MAG: pyruvate:ferredoxin (flavodoxin) oxidoreductase [Candidatus Cloacimonetes bacterium]|jgi:pyruvate-ferredoxin/flavodoxin oxidoreductase|nr:pyruvate:ferredoxin (flavodoxin) oxidoreductase [Candidatus Cloacimonadota bacterium]MDY0338043.1 pyruvate:ferredoxin (flavodoxin) oxidoreductase [Candidatus Cloacimonadaceae bacterium]MCK9334437.1 pyruvate:ferredoxin (flavodoxin) oxidoreductase [Candidatus Cloacimonadota bacterium]MDD2683556.1 pyruvate:ferredoxin (flavodoxin) oxidoreductase [Candidatus Cloacimonadota bacterium]MDD3097377.1 pyruvate:ferredoxin (flavodoxin) oxidoreductase [Candidatus Cloacimonadota bacterium]